MVNDARIESTANTLIIQGYVERTEDGGWRITEDGYHAFIALTPLVPLADLLTVSATMTEQWVEEARKREENK